MGFLPEHVSPVLLMLAAMGVAALLGLGRWWLIGIPALLGLVAGLVVDAAGTSLHDVPPVPFVVEIATIATFSGLVVRHPHSAHRSGASDARYESG